jgi:long-chain acyl-CoA synthetase
MQTLTADDAEVLARRGAGSLVGLGLRTGERLAILLPVSGDHADDRARREAADVQRDVLALVYGALRCGVVPVMVNPALTSAERDVLLADAAPALVVDDPKLLRQLLSGDAGEADLAEVPLARPMHFTSGTTGRSKGVWTGILNEADARLMWFDEIEAWDLTEADVLLTHGPLAHSAPLRFGIATLMAGGSVALPGWFDAGVIARALVEVRPTVAFTVPSHLQRLLSLSGGAPASPYRLLIHAGASCPAPLKRQIHDWAGAERTVEFYGATEGQFSVCPGVEWEHRPGTVGRARAGRSLRADDGVIWCAPPAWSSFEYWNDPVKTRSAWRVGPDGRREFSVGDLGRLDHEGYLYIDGRRDDLVITGGVNVYPDEVEGVLLGCPDVLQVAVFGVEDERWGQRVCAAVVGPAQEADLRAWAQVRLAGYKRPKSYYWLDDLPRTESGKIRRLAVAGMLGLE